MWHFGRAEGLNAHSFLAENKEQWRLTHTFTQWLPSAKHKSTRKNEKQIKTDYTYSTLDILIRVVGSTVFLSIHAILQNPAYLWFPEYSFFFFFFFFSFSYMSVFYASAVGSVVKDPHECRRPKRCRFNPCVGKICWRRKWESTPVLLPSKFHGQGSLVGYSPWGHKHDGAPMQPSCVLYMHLNTLNTYLDVLK